MQGKSFICCFKRNIFTFQELHLTDGSDYNHTTFLMLQNRKAAPEVMLPVSLFWPTTSEANVGVMAVEA